MKSKELIRQLQACDPTGEMEVCFGGDISDVFTLPWFYDGRASIFIKDEEGEIIGMREATEKDGDKIVIITKTVEDLGWEEVEHNEDGREKISYIIEGSNHFKERFERGRNDAIKCMENIKKKYGNHYIPERRDVGVLVYFDEYYNIARFQFYYGGDDWTDPSVLDLYDDREKIINIHFNGNENRYENFLERIYFKNMINYMENDYSLEKGLDETVEFFKKEETGWKWVDIVPDAYKD